MHKRDVLAYRRYAISTILLRIKSRKRVSLLLVSCNKKKNIMSSKRESVTQCCLSYLHFSPADGNQPWLINGWIPLMTSMCNFSPVFIWMITWLLFFFFYLFISCSLFFSCQVTGNEMILSAVSSSYISLCCLIWNDWIVVVVISIILPGIWFRMHCICISIPQNFIYQMKLKEFVTSHFIE